MATKTAEDRTATLRDSLQDLDLRDRLQEVVDRAEHVRDDVVDRVPELLEDLDPAKRRLQMTGWELFRRLVGVLLVLPRLLVRVLGALPRVVEEVAEHGADLGERTREAATAIPTVRRLRRRRRIQVIAWTAGGFAAGAVTGWLVARSRPAPLSYEATQGATDDQLLPNVNGAAPVAADAVVRE